MTSLFENTKRELIFSLTMFGHAELLEMLLNSISFSEKDIIEAIKAAISQHFAFAQKDGEYLPIIKMLINSCFFSKQSREEILETISLIPRDADSIAIQQMLFGEESKNDMDAMD